MAIIEKNSVVCAMCKAKRELYFFLTASTPSFLFALIPTIFSLNASLAFILVCALCSYTVYSMRLLRNKTSYNEVYFFFLSLVFFALCIIVPGVVRDREMLCEYFT